MKTSQHFFKLCVFICKPIYTSVSGRQKGKVWKWIFILKREAKKRKNEIPVVDFIFCFHNNTEYINQIRWFYVFLKIEAYVYHPIFALSYPQRAYYICIMYDFSHIFMFCIGTYMIYPFHPFLHNAKVPFVTVF